MKKQPIDNVEWVDRDALRANHYNPNKVMPPELALLKRSILENGWTQPIVARSDGEIIDGFHRWTIAADPEIAKLTDGYVPVVRVEPDATGNQMAATVRHNRARGAHGVLPMADIVRTLVDEEGWTFEQIQLEFGMDDEEVDRLYDSGGMIERGSKDEFNRGWKPQ